MSSKKATAMIIFVVMVLATLAIVLVIWYDRSQQTVVDDATVILDGETQKELDVTLSDFLPGDSKSYTVQIKNGKEEPITVTTSFEKTGTDTLAPFIDVEICIDGEKADSAKLSEYLQGKTIVFPDEFVAGSTHEIQITYSMSIEVGDEAQRTTADFNVVFGGDN